MGHNAVLLRQYHLQVGRVSAIARSGGIPVYCHTLDFQTTEIPLRFARAIPNESVAAWTPTNEEVSVLKGLGDLGNLGNIFKQAMNMKAKVEELKEKLADERVEATAGGGMVTVVMNGKFEVDSVAIDPDVIDREDPEMLETLVRAAMNEGVRKVQDLVKERMSEVAGGIDIPGLTV